jgi:hypothetical protein
MPDVLRTPGMFGHLGHVRACGWSILYLDNIGRKFILISEDSIVNSSEKNSLTYNPIAMQFVTIYCNCEFTTLHS